MIERSSSLPGNRLSRALWRGTMAVGLSAVAASCGVPPSPQAAPAQRNVGVVDGGNLQPAVLESRSYTPEGAARRAYLGKAVLAAGESDYIPDAEAWVDGAQAGEGKIGSGEWLIAIGKNETDLWHPKWRYTNSKGAKGPMQLLQASFDASGVKESFDPARQPDILDVRDAEMSAANLLSRLSRDYGFNKYEALDFYGCGSIRPCDYAAKTIARVHQMFPGFPTDEFASFPQAG